MTDPKRTIPRSTILGITIATLLYVLGTTAVMGLVPREQLVHSIAPFSDAARVLWGPWGATTISLAVILSALGALNGWTLLMGQVPMAAARDKLFPSVFSRLSPRGVPATGIVISAMLATVLVMAQVGGGSGFSAIYNLVVSLSTMAAVVPYAFCALATGLVAAYAAGGGPVPRLTVIEVTAFVFSVFTLYGCGARSRALRLHNARARHSGLRLAATSRLTRREIIALSFQAANHVTRGHAVAGKLVREILAADEIKSKPSPEVVRIIN